MHNPMGWGGHRSVGFGGSGQQMNVPLIPAPVAFVTMMVGLVIGCLIGRKHAMMHGAGPGMSCCGDDWSAMSAHHHHGDGMPGCGCGCGDEDFE